MGNHEQMLAEFYELAGMERKIADILIEKLKALGLRVEEDDTGTKIGGNTGNLRAILPGDPTLEPVLFSAHMDRVGNNGHISPILDREQGLLRADGKTILAADDVAGICVILQALRMVQAQHIPHGDIEVAFSVCEEQGVLGSRHYDFSIFRSRKAFVFDIPVRLGRIVNQAPAKGRVIIHVKGKEAHAGNEPEKGLNALRVAAALILALPDGRITPKTTANFGMITAASSTNVVCGEAVITGEFRSTNETEYEETERQIQAAAKLVADEYHTEIQVSVQHLYHTFYIPETEDICKIAVTACRNLCIEPTFSRGGGGMDGNHFNAMGIQAIGIAPGYSKNHTAQEQLVLGDFYRCATLAAELIKVVGETRKAEMR